MTDHSLGLHKATEISIKSQSRENRSNRLIRQPAEGDLFVLVFKLVLKSTKTVFSTPGESAFAKLPPYKIY